MDVKTRSYFLSSVGQANLCSSYTSKSLETTRNISPLLTSYEAQHSSPLDRDFTAVQCEHKLPTAHVELRDPSPPPAVCLWIAHSRPGGHKLLGGLTAYIRSHCIHGFLTGCLAKAVPQVLLQLPPRPDFSRSQSGDGA